MAYNPFDDVIDQDPAYMANGGDLVDEDPSTKPLDITLRVQRPTPTPPVPDFISQGRQIRDKQEKLQKLQDLYTQSAFTQSMQPVYEQRQQEDFSDVQQTIGAGVAPIFEGIAASETADRGKAKKEKNEQIKQQLGFGNQLLSKSQMDEAKQYGYEPLTIGETFAAIPDFMYGDQAESFRKLADGEQLEDGDKYNIITSPLDALDFLGVGIASGAVFKLFKRLKDKYKVPNLQKILDNPAFAGDSDVEEARQIVMGAAPPQGLPIEQGGRGQTVMFDKPDVPGDISPGSGLLDDIDTTKGKGKFQIEKVAQSIDKINEVVKKVQTGELKPNLGIDQYEGLTRDFFNKALSGKYSFDVGKYLDLPIDEIQQLLASKKSLRMRNFKKNFKDIEEYIGKADAESLTNPEMADLFDVDIDMIKKNFSSKPEYKSKFIQSKYTTPSDNYSFERILKENQKELGIEKVSKGGNEKRAEYLLFDGLFRSTSNKDLGLPSTASRKEAAQKFIEYIKKEKPNWKTEYRAELNNLAYLDQQRAIANRTITSMFNDYKAKYPEQFANENLTEYKLQISHNFPLRGDPKFLQGADLDAARLSYSRTNNVHHAKIESQVLKIKNDVDKTGKITEKQLKKLEELDKKAKKLGTLYFTDIGGEIRFIGEKKAPGINTLVNALEKHFIEISKRKGAGRIIKGEYIPGDFSTKEIGVTGKYGDEFTPRPFNKGGPVRMAIGGDPLTNLNQQQFSPDPAFEGQDYFQEAVDSGNLQAFNPTKLFKLFNRTDAVYTPKKLPDPVAEQQAAPPGTTLPTTQVVQPKDFAFQSFTLNKINDPQAPKAGTPEAWRQFLYGGGQGGKVPESEMFDTGLEQYLDDYAKYYPDQKITKEQLTDYYEMSPIGNIEIKVKADLTNEEITNPGYRNYVGRPRHANSGSQPLDSVGTNYREIVVNSGPLPGDKKPFVESGHFNEKNVLGFTRVANYNQPDGTRVAVIQELQTDMLTKVRKEQERLQALLKRIENIKATANRELQTGDTFRGQDANRILDTLNAKIPPTIEQSLIQNADLIKPFPNEAARSTIPDYQKQLTELQSQIDLILSKDIKQSNPETGFTLKNISDKQQAVLDNLMDLNRSGQLDDLFKGIDVPASRETDDLRRYAEDPNVRSIEEGLSYNGTKKLELFPPVPFNKQADYVDLLLKATIKDAQSRGIQKVAIYPSDLVNQRWGKNPNSEAGKKFTDLYGKVAIQQMKNIAKKYGGTAKVETVMNPNLSDRGLTYYKRNLEGEYEYLKQDQLAQGLDPEEAQLLINEQLGRNSHTLGANQVIYTREIAPGQSMDYYVQPIPERVEMQKSGEFSAKNEFELVPLGPGDDRNAAQVLIEEYDPREIQMFTITLDSDKAQKPMFMFKKKSGGTIAKDSLLSITDIYGEYGR